MQAQKKMQIYRTSDPGDVDFMASHTPANSFTGENHRRLERSTRASCRLFGVTGMLMGWEGFGDRKCHAVVEGEVARWRCGSGTNVLAFVTPPASEREDSVEMDPAIARGERGNANLMELKRPLAFSFSSFDLFGDVGGDVADADVFDEDEESAKCAKVGAGGRSGGVAGACEGSIQKCVSGEITISSTSYSSSNAARSVAMEWCIEDSSSPSASS